MINHQNFKKLFQEYLENQCSPEEAETVLAWLEVEGYSQEQNELICGLLPAFLAWDPGPSATKRPAYLE